MKLADICDYATDRTNTSALNKSNYISTENMLPNKSGITVAAALPTTTQIPAYKIDDVLVSNIRPYFKKIWKANFDGGCSADVLVFRAKENVNSDFLYYVLSSDKFFEYSMATSKGTKMPRGDKKSIMEFEVPNFDFPTQKKIAEVLSCLDPKIELNRRINENLEQQAQAIFKEWFVDNDNCPIGTLGDYAIVKSGYAFKSSWWTDSGATVVKIKSIDNGRINFADCDFVAEDKISFAKEFIAKTGDVVIAMTGATLGKFAIIPKYENTILINQRVGKFFLGDNPLDKLPFLYCCLNDKGVISEIINRGQGSAQANISGGDIMATKCVRPSNDEIEKFNNLTKPFFETILANDNESRILSQIRDALLPKLMNGELKI